ncbi:WXG100 family type VII secretion target [Janibacter anophelis]|uniref:WXG100 family type VII secretion target n=1 Tax=Janibacter anophelis TaxID=319054 RepID=UPI000AB47878|nr:hypothetical protein [Janibacter anophelis]
MAVTHGGDPTQMRQVAGQLKASGERITDSAAMMRGSRQVLVQSWEGADAEALLRSAEGAEGQLTSAADVLIAFAARLIEQADQQQGASEGSVRTAGSPPPGVVADNNDARDNHWWNLRKKDPADYETDGDPGTDIEMPEGLDPDSQLAKDLMATPQGRETLEWLRKNDIEIKYSDKEGAWYSAYDNSITFGVDGDGNPKDSPDTLIHEANHAQWDADDKVVDINSSSREEYIKGKLDEEIEGQSERWAWNQQAREQGMDVPMGSDEAAYREAVQEATAAGATPAEAEQAGREEVRKMFEGDHPSVNYTQSTDGQNYAERHGDDWDDKHDWWPLW